VILEINQTGCSSHFHIFNKETIKIQSNRNTINSADDICELYFQRQDGYYRPQQQQQHGYYHRPQGAPINKPNENGGILTSISNGFNNLVSNIFG
jgi:hypothetical protein